MPNKLLKKNDGFTLLEAIVSVGILAIVVAIVMYGITAYLNYTRQDFIYMCLVEAAQSGIQQAQADPSTVGTNTVYTCGSLPINVSTSIVSGNIPNPPPPPYASQSSCAVVESDATYSGQTSSIRGEVCNFQ